MTVTITVVTLHITHIISYNDHSFLSHCLLTLTSPYTHTQRGGTFKKVVTMLKLYTAHCVHLQNIETRTKYML